MLPLPNVEYSIEEFNYATKKLGAMGVKVSSNSEGVYLGDERLKPIIVSLDKIIFGTDYPYVPAQVILRKKKIFDAEIKLRNWTEKIYFDNSRAIFGG